MKKLTGFLTLIVFLFACSPGKKSQNSFETYNYSIQKKLVADRGAVVSAHALASKAGVEIMKQGGNAFDAAIATQLALAVVFPAAGNLGGGGFLVATRPGGETISIDYRETAPAKAHRDMYIDSAGNARTDQSQSTHLASGIPGTVAGLFESARYAKLPFEKLLAPAIQLAAKGFILTEAEARSFNRLQGDLNKYNTRRSAFVRDQPWKAGDTLVQADLARTLERIRDQGMAGFYEGETARLIEEEMKRGNGIITRDDLKNYKAKPREAHVFNYKGYRIVGMGMPSSGGLLVHQMMKMIEPFDIAAMGFQSTAAVQLMTEVERRAFADRAEYMGDADFVPVPVARLTSESYLRKRMADYQPGLAGKSENISAGQLAESMETTHLSVIDSEGNAVAVTTTLNGSYGNRIVIGGAGFFMNNEMDDFSIKAGVPNMFGALGGVANAIQPGKRMLSSMTPTVVLKDQQPFLVLGTPGGTTIPTSVFQSLVNILEFDMSTEDALYKPKFHHQWQPDHIGIETEFLPGTAEALRKMGYTLVDYRSIGRTEIIRVLAGGKFEAVADNRGEDAADGW